MKKILFLLVLIYNYSFSMTCSYTTYGFTALQPGSCEEYHALSASIPDNCVTYNVNYHKYVVDTVQTAFYEYSGSTCPLNKVSAPIDTVSGMCSIVNGVSTCSANPDPMGGSRCRDLFQKNGTAYTCNPNTNEATPIPNSNGTTYDPDNGEDIPNCNDGYSATNMPNMSVGGGGSGYKSWSCSQSMPNVDNGVTGDNGVVIGADGSITTPNPAGGSTTVFVDGSTSTIHPDGSTTTTPPTNTPPIDSGTGTSGGSTGGTDSGSGSSTGGTSGTGSTGGTTGTDTGSGSTGGTTGTTDTGGTSGTDFGTGTGTSGGSGTAGGGGSTGGTSGTGTTDTTVNPDTNGTDTTGNGNCGDANLTLQEKMLCQLKQGNDMTNNRLGIADTNLEKINKNLQGEDGKPLLSSISELSTKLLTPVTSSDSSSYSSQINSKVTGTLTDSFSKYSNVLGLGSSYGNPPANINLTLFGQVYVLIDFSLLSPYVDIIRSIFLTLAYLYGFMNLIKGNN